MTDSISLTMCFHSSTDGDVPSPAFCRWGKRRFFLLKSNDFLLKPNDFRLKTDDLQLKIDEFPLKTDDF